MHTENPQTIKKSETHPLHILAKANFLEDRLVIQVIQFLEAFICMNFNQDWSITV